MPSSAQTKLILYLLDSWLCSMWVCLQSVKFFCVENVSLSSGAGMPSSAGKNMLNHIVPYCYCMSRRAYEEKKGNASLLSGINIKNWLKWVKRQARQHLLTVLTGIRTIESGNIFSFKISATEALGWVFDWHNSWHSEEFT